jgi:hypothetical protein
MVSNTGKERRRSPRLDSSMQTELLLEFHAGKARQSVRVINSSLLGVGIRSIGTLVQGQTVTLIPSDRSPNAYSCRVAWVKQLGSQLYSEAGLEFCGVARRAPAN